MIAFGRIIVCVVAIAAVAVLAGDVSAPPAAAASAATGQTYGMRRYIDVRYRFSFWYPRALQIKASTTKDDARFPGGVAVETLQVGPAGGVSVYVVNSPASTITDEPNGHASPIAQTKYFYDASSGRWMVAYPEGRNGGGSGATTAADVSKKTIGGLPILLSDARFDATIIPLSTTQFIVVQDGGGSTFTRELADTVEPAGARVEPAAQSAALQAEAAAYTKQ